MFFLTFPCVSPGIYFLCVPSLLLSFFEIIFVHYSNKFFCLLYRGVARKGGGSWGARDPPLVGLLLCKQATIFRWRKRHDNILAVKGIVEKPTFLKFVFFVKYFRQRLLSLVNMGLHAAIIRLSPLIHEGEQQYKPYIVG